MSDDETRTDEEEVGAQGPEEPEEPSTSDEEPDVEAHGPVQTGPVQTGPVQTGPVQT